MPLSSASKYALSTKPPATAGPTLLLCLLLKPSRTMHTLASQAPNQRTTQQTPSVKNQEKGETGRTESTLKGIILFLEKV